MKSLQRRFELVSKRNAQLSTIMCFVKTISGQHFCTKTILYWFKKVVDSDDYSPTDKHELLKHMYKITNIAEEGMSEHGK